MHNHGFINLIEDTLPDRWMWKLNDIVDRFQIYSRLYKSCNHNWRGDTDLSYCLDRYAYGPWLSDLLWLSRWSQRIDRQCACPVQTEWVTLKVRISPCKLTRGRWIPTCSDTVLSIIFHDLHSGHDSQYHHRLSQVLLYPLTTSPPWRSV